MVYSIYRTMTSSHVVMMSGFLRPGCVGGWGERERVGVGRGRWGGRRGH